MTRKSGVIPNLFRNLEFGDANKSIAFVLIRPILSFLISTPKDREFSLNKRGINSCASISLF
jgi:hypothetical protein